MSESAFQNLSRVLQDGAPPAELEQQLDERELQQVADAVEAMHKHQEQALEHAMEQALSHVPAMLRKTVRRVLFS
jgi:hypothetical protein